jgi:hypothetical protein
MGPEPGVWREVLLRSMSERETMVTCECEWSAVRSHRSVVLTAAEGPAGPSICIDEVDATTTPNKSVEGVGIDAYQAGYLPGRYSKLQSEAGALEPEYVDELGISNHSLVIL